MLRCVLEVGPSKPVGYLPLSDIRAAKSASESVAVSALSAGWRRYNFLPKCAASKAVRFISTTAQPSLLFYRSVPMRPPLPGFLFNQMLSWRILPPIGLNAITPRVRS